MRQQHLALLLLAICAASSSYAAPVSHRNARLLSIARELIDVVFDAADAQEPVTPEPVRVVEGNTLGCWDSSTKKWFRCWTYDRLLFPEDQKIDDLWRPFPGLHHDTGLDSADQIESTQRPTPRIVSDADDLDDYFYSYEEFEKWYDKIDDATWSFGDNPQDSELLSDDDDGYLFDDDDAFFLNDDYYYHPDWEPVSDDVAVRRLLSDKDRQTKSAEK